MGRIQTGDPIDIEGHISKRGHSEVRAMLYEAASSMLVRSQQWCSIKAWGVRIAAKRGHKRAVVALARKLAVIMHAMWRDGSEFRFTQKGGRGSDTIDAQAGGARRRVMSALASAARSIR